MAQRSGKRKIIVSFGILLGLALALMLGGGACTKESASEKAGREAREAFEKSKELLKDGYDKTKELTRDGLQKGGEAAKEGLEKTQEAAKDFSKGWKEGGSTPPHK